MDYLLEERLDDKTPIKIELSSPEVILGSDYITALKNYSKVSKSHARLNFHNDSWYIEDLRSKYGVFLDSEKIGKNPKEVQNFSVIGLGGDFCSDDAFLCKLCPVKKIVLKRDSPDRDLSENKISRKVRKKSHSKDKLSSSEQNIESIYSNLNNQSERNWKMGLYFKCLEPNFKENDNFNLQDESLTDDDDVQSTSSSVEIWDKIIYPSELALSQIQKSQNNMQSSSAEKVHKSKENNYLGHSSSSVESLDIIIYPSKSILSKIQKSKQSIERSADLDNEQLHSYAKHKKLSKSLKVKSKCKNKPKYKTLKNDNDIHFPSQNDVSQNCSEDELNSKEYKVSQISDTLKTGTNIYQSSPNNAPKSVVSEIQKSKQSIERSADLDNEQLHSSANHEKLSKSLKVTSKYKNKPNYKTLKNDNDIQIPSQNNVSQNWSEDEPINKEYKGNLRSGTLKTGKNIYQSSPNNAQKNKSLHMHSKTKSINSPKRSARKSFKDFKIPRLSNGNHVNHTKCSAEVNHSVLSDSDECPGNTKHPTVKKRSDDYGSRMKLLLKDMMSNPNEKCIKQKKIMKSIRPQEVKKGHLRSSIRSQVPSQEATSIINNHVEEMISNTQIEFNSSISDKSTKLAENENMAAKSTPNLKVSKPADNLVPNLSATYRSENICKKFKSNESNLKVPVPLESEKLKNPSVIKDNSNLLHTHLQSTEYEVTQMDSSYSVSSEYTEYLGKNGEKELDSISYSELISKHNSNTGVSPSVKSGSKYSGSSAKTGSTGNRNNCCYELIKKIVEMNPKWLYEKEEIKVPPSSITNGVCQLPLSFTSYDQYVNSFLQMILLEVWETVCIMSEPYLKSKNENEFYFSVLSSYYVHGLMKLECESIVNKDQSFSPYNNSLVILDLKEDKENGPCLPSFGLIRNVSTEPLDIESMSKCQWKFLPKEWLQNASVWKYNVYVKSRGITIAKSVMKGNGICNLEDKINLTDALSSLKHSPMVDCILCPDWATFLVKCDILHSYDYMTIQNNICNAVFNEMTLPNEEKKIILLEGPPGSGKTEVIARFCQKLIENVPKTFKILVTAPSHFAVDNIANQMIELNRRLGSEDIKFIRTGDKRFIDHKHLKYSLCEKLDNFQKKIHLEKERIHKKINSFQKMSSKGRHSYVKEIAQLELELKSIKWDEKHEIWTILNDTNIVLSTFSDCFNLYETKINFSCCIFDEVNQATEPDTLFPFMFKNTKFFILGDTKQLPPIVKSDLAIKYGFQRSILERFQTYFMNQYKKSPAIQLKMQFRMHGDISIFPLRTFYFKDYNPPQYSYSFKKWFLEPYIILDDISETLKVNSFYDKTGCSVIKSLCSSIIKHDPVCSTAIIVPSDLQKELYMSELDFSTIKVYTIDNIQGQEKSMCILSCYQGSTSNETFNKHFSCKRRLNVALTRASHCLIICGPLHLLEKVPCWNALLKDSKDRNCYIPFSHGDNIFEIFEEKILKN